MSNGADEDNRRRIFLKRSAALGSLLPLAQVAPLRAAPSEASVTKVPGALSEPARGYLSLGADEAAFVESMVDAMCPADALTPAGTACGLAVYIDRQLAGDFGRGARRYSDGPWLIGKPEHGPQLPMTPAPTAPARACRQSLAAEQAPTRAFASVAP